jgi:hypothetical protein
LLSTPDPDHPLSFLDSVRIAEGELVVVDRKEGLAWRAPVANIELRRQTGGLTGQVDLAFAPNGRRADVNASFIYDSAEEVIDLSASFLQVRLPAMAAAVSELAPLGGVTSPLRGRASATVGIDGSLEEAYFELWGGPGEISIPDLVIAPLPLRSLNLEGGIDGAARRLTLATAALDFGTAEEAGPAVELSGSLTSSRPAFAGDWDIEAEARLGGVPLDDLKDYWPESVAPNARPWVTENILSGMAEEVVASANFAVPGGKLEALEVRSLTGRMAYSGLEVHYLRPLPPIVSVSGTTEFDQDKMAFSVTSGRLDSISVETAEIVIDNLLSADTEKGIRQSIHIDLLAEGPVHRILELLNHERLDLVAGLGIDPDGSAGHARARTTFAFPLIKALKFDHVEITSSAEMTDVAMRDMLMGQDVTAGQLQLDLTRKGMQVEGPLNLGGIPLVASWQESFSLESEIRSLVQATVPLVDDEGRRKLGLDFGERLEGPTSASVTYIIRRDGPNGVDATLDLRDARLALPSVRWEKPSGVPGEAKLAVEMVDGKVVSYSSIEIEAGSLLARGRGLPNQDGRDIAYLALDEFRFGNSALSDVTLTRQGDGFDIAIGGGVLDVTAFAREQAGGGAVESASEPFPTSGSDDGVYASLRLRAPNLTAIFFAPQRSLEAVSLDLYRSEAGWETIHFSGRVPRRLWYNDGQAGPSGALLETPAGVPRNPGSEVGNNDSEPPEPVFQVPDPNKDPERERTFTVDFRRHPEDGYALYAASNDAGAVLRALGLVDHMEGGSLELSGRSGGPLPKHPIAARVEAHKFVLHNAPAMARLLTVASLTGLLSVLNGDGIYFERLVGEFNLDDGLGTTDLMRAYGPSIGLTAKGSIHFDTGQSDLKGTVVPAYTFNRLLGKIPLFGWILTGGEGGGIIAVTYTMKGHLGDPAVDVNPLSALAPGFLRGILTGTLGGGDGGDGGDAPAQAFPEGRDR